MEKIFQEDNAKRLAIARALFNGKKILLIDEGTFKEEDSNLTAGNPIDFPEYTEKHEKAEHDSGMKEGVISGLGEINGLKVSIACMDFNFMGGSMGSVVGEK